MKTFKVTLTEDEVKALIDYHRFKGDGQYTIETSQRIHDLTKRLNKETPEIENDPRPKEEQGPTAPEGSVW